MDLRGIHARCGPAGTAGRAVRGARRAAESGFHAIADRLARFPDRELWHYRGRDIERRTFRQVFDDVLATCAALEAAGVRAGTHVGILGGNSYAWIVTDLALTRLRAVSVALSVEGSRASTTGELRAAYHLGLLLMAQAEYDRRTPAEPWAAPLGDLGGATVAPPAAGAPAAGGDAFTLVFSSGSSGSPKCIMMSARGTVAAMEEYAVQLRTGLGDAIFVVLPLTAFPQRLMVYLAVWCGFDIRLADIPRLHDALRRMEPTIVVGPPAFFEAVESRYRARPEGARRHADRLRRLTALIPLPALRRRVRRHLFADLHALFGGRARLLLTGSAPARRSTLRLLDELGFPIHEFYGMTEVSVVSWNLPGRTRHGSVGRPCSPAPSPSPPTARSSPASTRPAAWATTGTAPTTRTPTAPTGGWAPATSAASRTGTSTSPGARSPSSSPGPATSSSPSRPSGPWPNTRTWRTRSCSAASTPTW
ncbi:AMP-binding protein [Streptomyces stramineus]